MTDYKQTLNLPQTAFPMKGNLAQREPEMLKRWEDEGLQRELRESGQFPVIMVFAGVDGAGKTQTINLLNQWMDPRWLVTRAYDEPSEEERERPEYWRFWRDLPPFRLVLGLCPALAVTNSAINGVAMGGGFEIALACDLIIASENATFALPEPKVGLAALAGGLNRLPRQIGAKRALGMILTGRHVPAAEGHELGFVNEVVPHDELMAAARRWAEQICECAPLSIRASKDVVYRSLDTGSLADSMAAQYDSVKAMVNSEDFVEGPLAFAEKRPPQWKGR